MGKYRTLSENNQYYLPKHAYLTCIHFALQYRDWKAMLEADRDTRGAVRYDKDKIQTSGDYDSTSSTAMRMVEIQREVEMIDDIISEVADVGMQQYLRLSVCYGFTFYQLEDQRIPCSRKYIAKLRQRFYYELSKKI